MAMTKPSKATNNKKKGKWPMKKGYVKESQVKEDGWSQVNRKDNKKFEAKVVYDKNVEKAEVKGVEVSNSPHDDKIGLEASSALVPPPLHLDDNGEKKNEEVFAQVDCDMAEPVIYEEDFTPEELERMMKEPVTYEEELTPEELEKRIEEPVDIEAMTEVGAEAPVDASPISVSSNNSTMKKLQDLEMINFLPSLSDGGWKRGCDGAEDSATSKLKGGSNKKIRVN